MSENTKIEWCTHTQNFWEGCQPVGSGCEHCYAEARNARFGGGVAVNWGPGALRRRTSEANWRKPLTWNVNHAAFFAEHGHRQSVFCSSLSDWADNAVPDEWRIDAAQVILATPNLDWLLLTKRIGNAAKMLAAMFPNGMPPNVWIGATIVNQEEANRDIPKLLDVPAAKHFLSMEPLLGSVDLTRVVYPALKQKTENDPYVAYDVLRGHMIGPDDVGLQKLDWVIVGGESGPGARPMHPDWARSLRDQCKSAGVPFLFKQWGEWKPISQIDEAYHSGLYVPNVIAKPHEDQDNLNDIYGKRCTTKTGVVHPDGSLHHITKPMAFIAGAMQTFKVGKKAAGRLLDGRTWDGVPS